MRGLGHCDVIIFNQSLCVMSSTFGKSRARRLYIFHDPPLFTLFSQHGGLLNGSPPFFFFSCNPMMRNVHFYRENHIIDRTGGGWLVRKYGLRPPTPPQIREYNRRNYYTRRRRELGSCLLEDLATDARPSHIIDATGGGWLVRKYGLRPPTPPYLREGLARVDRLAPPATPCLSSGLSDAADRLDELLLRAFPASLFIAFDVTLNLHDDPHVSYNGDYNNQQRQRRMRNPLLMPHK